MTPLRDKVLKPISEAIDDAQKGLDECHKRGSMYPSFDGPSILESAEDAFDEHVEPLREALEELEWLPSGHPAVQGRRMWTCYACTMTWREREAYSKAGPPPHSMGCWLAPLLGRQRYLTSPPDDSQVEQT